MAERLAEHLNASDPPLKAAANYLRTAIANLGWAYSALHEVDKNGARNLLKLTGKLLATQKAMVARLEETSADREDLPTHGCPACATKRRHTAEDWRHHQGAGSGHNDAMAQPKEAADASV